MRELRESQTRNWRIRIELEEKFKLELEKNRKLRDEETGPTENILEQKQFEEISSERYFRRGKIEDLLQ